MKREAALPVLIACAALLGTAATFALPSVPERRTAVSDDGRLTVTADAAMELSVTASGTVPPSYRVESGGKPLAVPFALSYSSLAPDAPLAFFGFDEATLAWRRIDAASDPARGTIVGAGIPGTAEYLAASTDLPEPHPNAPRVLSAMLENPPLGAVGYEATLSVSPAQGEQSGFFEARTDAFPSRGGCAGTFASGSGESAATREIEAPHGLTRVLVRWQVDGGCEPGQAISPSS